MSDWIEQTLTFSDGYRCFARRWQPPRPRGTVLYLHGIQSHGGWFETSAGKLAESGFDVLLPDRRGSGCNQQDRGHTPNARRLLHDAVEWLHLLNPNGPSQVAGVSWGGKLALALQRFAPARISRLALIAPGLFPQVDLPLIQKVRVGLSMWAAPKARFEIPLNDPDLFTANPARREFIRDDPLKLTHVTTSFLLASRRLDRYARAAQSDPTGCPLCLFLAGHDRIIHNQPTRNFVRMLRWPGRTIVDYPDAHHTLEFEREPSDYLQDLTAWIRG